MCFVFILVTESWKRCRCMQVRIARWSIGQVRRGYNASFVQSETTRHPFGSGANLISRMLWNAIALRWCIKNSERWKSFSQFQKFQVQILLAELNRIAKVGAADEATGGRLPIILSGDFNLQPHSAPYNLIVNGESFNCHVSQLNSKIVHFEAWSIMKACLINHWVQPALKVPRAKQTEDYSYQLN